MRLRLAGLLVLLTLTVPSAGAQQQPSPLDTPIFRSAVDAIELDAFVFDAQGNPVTDLTENDFEIIEDGQPQEIASFAVVNIPIETTVRPVAASTAVADVRTNEQPEGRIYLIAVDEIPGGLVPRLRLRLRQFVEQHFGENDSAAIVYVGRGRSTDGQDFTTDRATLLRSIDKLSGGFGASDLETTVSVRDIETGANTGTVSTTQAAAGVGTPQATADAAAVPSVDGNVLGDREADFLLRSRMRSLRSLTEFMANMHGRRKSIVYVTTGIGASVYEALDYEGGVRSLAIEDLHGAITAATRGNVSIYPLDPGGITPGRDASEEAPPASDNTVAVSSNTAIGRMQDLRGLADATGGFAIVDTNNYKDAFTRVVRENSTYYVLGFTTSTPRTDGRFHKVQIRVKRPGLEVRSRGGYLAPLHRKTPIITRASTLAPAIIDALQSPIAVAGVPIRVFAAPYKASDLQAKVAITAEFGVEALNLVQRQGRLVGDLAVAIRPTSADGRLLAGQRHEMQLALKPESYALTRTRGVRVVTEMPLAPGHYQLRIAGGSTTGRAGSVTYDLEVPNYAKEPLVMSGVALTSSTAKETVTVWPAARPLDTKLPSPITAARTFLPEETVTLYTEVYENGKRAAQPVDFNVDLRSDAGRVLSSYPAKNGAKESNASGTTYGFVTPINLEGVNPGAYVLHVEARNSATKSTVTRDIPIRVR
ncbi:MAG TPA: VWA domain-containing protein [Vicinamibacterales bacterium]|nr:VWA domain-containing protein [Vicinamibacterales bacterium]